MFNCKPTSRQLEFMDWEFGAFFHFGLRAFYKGWHDWDERDMDQSVFNPEGLDCDSWIRAFKDAGAKYAILTCKHHDGFANWPSEYTDYSVKNTPWKNGKGDVVREFTDACRRNDMKVGLYYSPAQRDGSKFTTSKEYNDYFIGQLGELLTGYGKIDYLWFDGCGSQGYTFDTVRIIDSIRTAQPDIMIFGMWDPDVRWIGNEEGWAPIPNTYTFKNNHAYAVEKYGDARPEYRFLPGECDTDLRSTWFDCEDNEDTIYELDELMGLYEMSVGHGANLLLNIGPDKTGHLPKPDAARLAEFGAKIKEMYGSPLDFSSPVKNEDGTFAVRSQNAQLVNCAVLMEDLTEGESVKRFTLRSDKTIVYTGYGIGHKYICKFPTVKTAGLTLCIEDAEGDIVIRDIKAYYQK